MKPLLDDGFSGAKPSYIWSIPLAVVGLMLLRGICSYASTYLLAWVANNMLLGLRKEMFTRLRSEEHSSELQSLMRHSYAVLCLIHQTNQVLRHLPECNNTQI